MEKRIVVPQPQRMRIGCTPGFSDEAGFKSGTRGWHPRRFAGGTCDIGREDHVCFRLLGDCSGRAGERSPEVIDRTAFRHRQSV